MFELKGKYNFCKVFTDKCDNETISQLVTLLNQPYTEGLKIRIMPDCHAGAGCVIGTTMTIVDKIVPNLVGVDIGCGMTVVELSTEDIDFEQLDSIIREYVPSGFSVRSSEHEFWAKTGINNKISKLHCVEHLKKI